ncbi:MAG: twin-arginine translocase TatA/TatE family subunit [Alphaproteobacteria bacterium]|jgi:sec-independent protein translocase protein TatA|nr:twin-arginine translocase TatA/TatE family subunit [Alphaproteobacteria bacterium]
MGISFWQILLILVVVVLLFGAGKIPRLMGDVAKGIRSFKSGLKDEETGEDGEQQPASPPRQLEGRSETAAGTGQTSAARNDERAHS